MSDYTSSQAGAWSNNATWGGSGHPVDGDTATIGHDVWIDGNTTVGKSLAATAAITINSGGTLRWHDTITGNWTLTIKGLLIVNNGGTFMIGGTGGTAIPAGYTATVAFAGGFNWQNIVYGAFKVYGCPSYHMASSGMQRARLIADAAAGAGVQFQVDRDVDWVVGDTLWFGTGGDPGHAPTACEQVTITSKINASTYQATFANNHFGSAPYGDIVVHGTRNVLIQGQSSTLGIAFYMNNAATGTFDVNWCRFLYGGMYNAAPQGVSQALFGLSPSASNAARVSVNNFKFKSIVVDTRAGWNVIYFNRIVLWEENVGTGDATFTNMDNIHVWGTYNYTVGLSSDGPIEFNENCCGNFNFGNLSFVNATNALSGNGTQYWYQFVHIKDLWYAGNARGSRAPWLYPTGLMIDNFRVHSGNGLLLTVAGSTVLYGTYNYLKNGQVFHNGASVAGNGVEILSTGIISSNLFHLYNIYCSDFLSGLAENRYYVLRVIGCVFTDTSGSTMQGFLKLALAEAARVQFHSCYFGTAVGNQIYTPIIDGGQARPMRVLFDTCHIEDKAQAFTFNTDYWMRDTFASPILNLTDWTDIRAFDKRFALEVVGGSVYNSAGENQFAKDFPNRDRAAYVHQGTVIDNIPASDTHYIDGTFARRFSLLMGTQRDELTVICPTMIPAEAGDTITAKLSLKKNVSISLANDRPKLHLVGCGIISEAVMSDVVDSYEEVSVSGTALYAGMMELTLSARGKVYALSQTPLKATAERYPNYAYPIDTWSFSNIAADSGLLTNMIAYYPLNGDANDAFDSLNGTLVNAPTVAQGRLAQSYLLNGTSQYVTLGTSASFETTRVSVAAWVRLAAKQASTRYIVAKSSSAGGTHIQWHLYKDYATSPTRHFWKFAVRVGGTVYIADSLLEATSAEWHLLVGTFDGSNVKIYVDNVLLGTTPASGDIDTNASLPVYIGAQTTGTGPYSGAAGWINAYADAVGIWSRVLTTDEIATLWNTGYGMHYSGTTDRNLILCADGLKLQRS